MMKKDGCLLYFSIFIFYVCVAHGHFHISCSNLLHCLNKEQLFGVIHQASLSLTMKEPTKFQITHINAASSLFWLKFNTNINGTEI